MMAAPFIVNFTRIFLFPDATAHVRQGRHLGLKMLLGNRDIVLHCISTDSKAAVACTVASVAARLFANLSSSS